MPLSELTLQFGSLQITARELRGGAIIFLTPKHSFNSPLKLEFQLMSTNKKVEQLIAQMENYLECWKQFNQFISLARCKEIQRGR